MKSGQKSLFLMLIQWFGLEKVRIRNRMFLGLPDQDPLVRGILIRILPFSQKGVERTEIMLEK